MPLLDWWKKVDLQGRTALHHAATADDKQSVLLLLAAGADAGAKDHDGRTALDDAVSDARQAYLCAEKEEYNQGMRVDSGLVSSSGGGSAEAAVGVAWLRASMLGPAPWDEGEDEGEGPAAEAECERTCAGRRRAPSRDSAPSSRSRPSTGASGLRLLRTAALPLEPEPPLSPPWARRPFVNIVGAVGDAGWLAPADPRHAAVTTIETILDRHAFAFIGLFLGFIESCVEQAFALADADKHSHSSYGSPNFGGIALDLDRGRAADSTDDIPCEPCLRLNEPPRDARDIWRNLQAKPQT
ncbi:Protein of unknown function [Gryllus bimaculatus]|nr:Protein of unknown function [Gryllus bimaculatus]